MEVQIAQILFQIINFGLVLGALSYLLYKPVLKVFDERSKRIAEGEKAAREALEGQENIEQLRKDTQRELKKERAEMLKTAQTEAKKMADDIVEKARKEADELSQKREEKWSQEESQRIKDMREKIIDASVSLAQKVVETKLGTAKEQQKLVDAQLDTVLEQL